MQETIDMSVALVTVWGLRVLSAILILIAGYVIGNWLKKMIQRIKKLDGILKSFLGNAAKYAVFAIALITILGQFGVQTASLLAVLGAAGLAIGLALQGTLSNVASGVMLLILRPFTVGDFIQSGGISGTVKDMSLFTTELAAADNVYTIVPNSKIWNNEIMNFTRNKQRRQDIVNGISYGDDINKAIKAIEKVLEKEDRLVRTEGKEPMVMVSALGDSSVNITARIWTTVPDYWAVKWDLTKSLKEALDSAGITIPFPTRTLEMPQEAVKALANNNKPAAKKAGSKKKVA